MKLADMVGEPLTVTGTAVPAAHVAAGPARGPGYASVLGGRLKFQVKFPSSEVQA